MNISNLEKEELYESINSIINEFLDTNILTYHEENFNHIIFNYINEIIYYQLEILYDNNEENEVNSFIELNIVDAINNSNILLRSKNTVDYNIENKDNVSEKLYYLDNCATQQQNSDEWYIARYKYLTASSMWKVFSTNGSKNSLIYNKCLPLNLNKYNSSNINLNSTLHWGHKYEPLSILYYEQTYNTKIKEYGCIPHKTIKYMAASPDGINYDKNSNRYGRMLEIKNVVSRKINGIPKKEYWIQMQIQMEVCDLNECDFLETNFKEYKNEDEFNNDGDFTNSSENKQKGIIMLFINNNNAPIYEYAPINITNTEFIEWEKCVTEKHNNSNNKWFSNIYWKLENVSCVLVDRNKNWFIQANIEIEKVWNIISKEKLDNSYLSRAPKKRVKQEEKNNMNSVKKCKIDLENLN